MSIVVSLRILYEKAGGMLTQFLPVTGGPLPGGKDRRGENAFGGARSLSTFGCPCEDDVLGSPLKTEGFV